MPYLEQDAANLASEAPIAGQNLLDFAVSNSPVIFYIAEVGGVQPLKFISSNVEGITGHKPEMFLQTAGARRNLLHPDDLPAFREAVNGLKSRHPSYETFSHEYRFRCADGAYLWFRDELTMTTDSDGSGQVIGCMIDVTAEKESQAALEESEQRFQLIVEGHPLPVFVTDLESREIIYESPAAAEVYGREWDPVNRPLVTSQYADTSDRVRFLEILRRDGKVIDFELVSRKADGTDFWSTLNSRLYQLDGRDVAITSIVDLSEHRKREDELRAARETLEDAIEALSEGFALYDADDNLVLCNEQMKAFNALSADLYVPGTNRHDILRTGVARGQFPGAIGQEEKWLERRRAEGHTNADDYYKTSDGRWFDRSHRPTRQGGLVVTLHDITEQRTVEQTLRDSEAFVRRVLDSCPIPIQMARTDGTGLYESPASGALFGQFLETGEKVLRRYVDPEDRDRYIETLRKTGRVDDYECRRRRADGSTFYASVSGRLIEFLGDEVIVSCTVDLTERKKQEADLRGARETLEDAIEALSEGIVLFDSDQKFVMCNQRYREFNEVTADLLVPGVRRSEFIRAGVERGQYVKGISAGKVFRYPNPNTGLEVLAGRSWEFQQSNGRWFLASNSKTRQGLYVGSRIDITERKKMEEALQESEAMFRRVLDACPIPITMYNITNATILYETPAAKQLFGTDAKAGDVRRSSRWADRMERDRQLKRLREVGYLDGVEVEYTKADGTVFPAALSARYIGYRGDDVIVTSIFDLSEMRAVEDEMARQRDVLHQSEKLSAIGELLAGVSHELNNPLSVLLGQAIMLKDSATDEAVKVRAEKLYSAADRCARIVKTFLALARQRPIEIESTDVNELIDEALEVTAYSLRSFDIDVIPRLEKGLPNVLADRDQVRQVITNLIINAEHALQEVGHKRELKIRTSYRKQTNEVVIKVKDNGSGISDDIRSRIFEPLFTTKDVGVGTGIGLALCHRIVEAHGGTIVLESPPGEGATFALRLPADMDAKVEAALAPGDVPQSAGYNILVIDDEPEVAKVLSDLLTADGHSTTIALSGEEGLRYIEKREFDLILCDIRMPKLDGPGFYRAMIQIKPKMVTRLAFVTGDYLSQQALRFLEGAGCPHVEKPATPDDLRQLVDDLCGDC